MIFNIIWDIIYIIYLVVYTAGQEMSRVGDLSIGLIGLVLFTFVFYLHCCRALSPSKIVWLVISLTTIVFVYIPWGMRTDIISVLNDDSSFDLQLVQLIINIYVLLVGILIPSLLPTIAGALGIGFFLCWVMIMYMTLLYFASVGSLLLGSIILGCYFYPRDSSSFSLASFREKFYSLFEEYHGNSETSRMLRDLLSPEGGTEGEMMEESEMVEEGDGDSNSSTVRANNRYLEAHLFVNSMQRRREYVDMSEEMVEVV
tara:strand:- start:142 stop:915 length:774 start_codon:yes stop_codon:yes gene_type:complete